MVGYAVHEQIRANDAQSSLEVARSQIEDLQSKSTAVTEASDNLKQQMERFDTEDWKDVMTEAKDAADEVDTAKDDLESSANDASSSG